MAQLPRQWARTLLESLVSSLVLMGTCSGPWKKIILLSRLPTELLLTSVERMPNTIETSTCGNKAGVFTR
jgi:hypothetical protein